jgi:hypothetical protein
VIASPRIASWILAASVLAAAAPCLAADPPDTSVVGEIRTQAKNLQPLVTTKLAKDFLDATSTLKNMAPRVVLHDSARTRYWTDAEAQSLPDTTRARLVTRNLDEGFYYQTRYGTPLAYVRALELLSKAGFTDVAGRKIADYGYGTIGHLRLLGAMGADAIGIDVDQLLAKLYSHPGDQGVVAAKGGKPGRVTLVHGSFPGDTSIARQVGSGLDLFLSKNTLKNGYIHPAEPVNPRMLVHLGVSDTTYVRTLAAIVKPGGYAMIYNLAPAPSPPGQPYKPWADGRCPFPRALWESAGFKVIEFDRDDSPAARAMGHALAWDQGESPMDLEKDLFATYTLVQKPK